MNSWTINIKGFGKINKASIQVTPFMMFVGENNSGKSYVLELLWGILTEADNIYRSLEVEEFQNLLDQIPDEEGEYDISKEFQLELLSLWNHAILKSKEKLLKKIFQFEISASEISIDKETTDSFKVIINLNDNPVFSEEDNDIDLKLSKTLEYKILVDGRRVINRKFGILTNLDSQASDFKRLIFRDLFLLFITADYSESNPVFLNRSKTKPLYLPASRTGFMQTYKAIVGNLLNDSVQQNLFLFDEFKQDITSIEGTNLTLPTYDFLSRLIKVSVNKSQEQKYYEELEFLNKDILKGEIKQVELGEFKFATDNNKSLPLHVTSSLISELAPISLFLRSSFEPKTWMIEEVESHLHPKVQMEVARLLFRLLNKKNNIWITTHSDTIMQVINNILTLAQNENKNDILKKMEWLESDLPTKLNEVKLYQFTNENGSTEVKELFMGKYGFEVPSFNNALENLLKETIMVQQKDIL